MSASENLSYQGELPAVSYQRSGGEGAGIHQDGGAVSMRYPRNRGVPMTLDDVAGRWHDRRSAPARKRRGLAGFGAGASPVLARLK